MDWSEYVTRIGALIQEVVVSAASSAPFTSDAANINLYTSIDYTENRLQSDLDFINTITTNSSGTLTPNSRLFTYPTAGGTFVVVQQLALIVGGERQPPLLPVSREYLDNAYPSNTPLTPSTLPACWTFNDGVSALVGPSPDSSYPVEVVGTMRCLQLSSSNTSNFLTENVPELYIAASMVQWSGYQRAYGAEADDPKMAMSWEQQYQLLMKTNLIEEFRKKFQSSAWGPRFPTPLANPPQT